MGLGPQGERMCCETCAQTTEGNAAWLMVSLITERIWPAGAGISEGVR